MSTPIPGVGPQADGTFPVDRAVSTAEALDAFAKNYEAISNAIQCIRAARAKWIKREQDPTSFKALRDAAELEYNAAKSSFSDCWPAVEALLDGLPPLLRPEVLHR